jgi:hypothetical protein
MLSVACVLKSGGEYKPEHVIRLRDAVARWLSLPYLFTCLTDIPQPDYHCILLKDDWPGWWSKISLFRPGLFAGPTLYLDLDTLITGPLDDIATGHRFTVLRNVWVDPPSPRIGSGVMAWDTREAPGLASIYERFVDNPARHMRQPQVADNLGDQGFIQRSMPFPAERWQDKHPGRVVSWRRHCAGGGVPPGASIVCFGGKVRPWRL